MTGASRDRRGFPPQAPQPRGSGTHPRGPGPPPLHLQTLSGAPLDSEMSASLDLLNSTSMSIAQLPTLADSSRLAVPPAATQPPDSPVDEDPVAHRGSPPLSGPASDTLPLSSGFGFATSTDNESFTSEPRSLELHVDGRAAEGLSDPARGKLLSVPSLALPSPALGPGTPAPDLGSPHSSWLSSSDGGESPRQPQPSQPRVSPPPCRPPLPTGSQPARGAPDSPLQLLKRNNSDSPLPVTPMLGPHTPKARSPFVATPDLEKAPFSWDSCAAQAFPPAGVPAWMDASSPVDGGGRAPQGILTPRTRARSADAAARRRIGSHAAAGAPAVAPEPRLASRSPHRTPSRPRLQGSLRSAYGLPELVSPGASPRSERASTVSRAWSNPIFFSADESAAADEDAASRAPSALTTARSLMLVGSHAGEEAPEVSSPHHRENSTLPTNSLFHGHDHSGAAGVSTADQSSSLASREGPDTDTLAAFLARLDDVERRISATWREEHKMRADELAVLEPLLAPAGAGAPGEASGAVVPRLDADDIVAASRAGARTARMMSPAVLAGGLPGLPADEAHASAVFGSLLPAEPRSLPGSPRKWQERALTLEYALQEHRVESEKALAGVQAQLAATERQLLEQQRTPCSGPVTPVSASAREAAASTALALESVRGLKGSAAEGPLRGMAAELAELERVVAERVEPLARHVAGMKRRMLSAQEEARELRGETAANEAALEEMQEQLEAMRARERSAVESASAEAADLRRQAHAASVEAEHLREALTAAREREATLRALADGAQVGEQLVPYAAHRAVLAEAALLRGQIAQLKADLEMLYMDEAFVTGAAGAMELAAAGGSTFGGSGFGGGAGRAAAGGALAGPGGGSAAMGMSSAAMTTTHRLAALLGYTEQKPGGQLSITQRSLLSRTPSFMRTSGHSLAALQPLQPSDSGLPLPSRSGSSHPSTSLPQSPRRDRSGGLSDLEDREPEGHSASSAGSPACMRDPAQEGDAVRRGGLPTREPNPSGHDDSLMTGELPGNTSVFMPMATVHAADNRSGALPPMFATAREHRGAAELAATVKKQAVVLADKDTVIASLKAQLAQATAAPRATAAAAAAAAAAATANEAARPCDPEGASGSRPGGLEGDPNSISLAGGDSEAAPESFAETTEWEEMPVPNTFRQALEQILMLQMSHKQLRGRIAAAAAARAAASVTVNASAQTLTAATPTLGAAAPAPAPTTPPRPPAPKPMGKAGAANGHAVAAADNEDGGEGAKAERQEEEAKAARQKEMASVRMLAEVLTSIHGEQAAAAAAARASRPLRPVSGEANGKCVEEEGGGTSGATRGSPGGHVLTDLEAEVFNNMVMRELSDRVVEWQRAHQDVSDSLVAANMRMAELQTDHDRLTAVIRNLMVQNEAHTKQNVSRLPGPGPRSMGPPNKRLQGFFGRLKTPRG